MAVEIDLTAVASDSEGSSVVEWVPPYQNKSQSQSRLGPGFNKPISTKSENQLAALPAQGDSASTRATTPTQSTKEFASKPTSQDGKMASLSFRSATMPKHEPDTTPSSTHHHPPVTHRTPKNQTPKKLDWNVDKVEEALRSFSAEIGTDEAKLTSRSIFMSWRKDALELDSINKKDWLAGMKRFPVEGVGKSADTMRIRTKQVGQGRAGKQEKREHFQVICIKTNTEIVPAYNFHHVEIRKNILSPNTMLTYVPHLRDLADNEEGVYRRWLENLENMDKTSGFATLSRHQKVTKTIQKELATTLLLYLDSWLERLGIENCTKATLIRYMASQSDSVTPQQKSSILNSYSEESGSPRSAKAVRVFTEAFDRVFNNPALRERAVPLRDVLLLDKSVDTIVDSKKWMKDTPSQSKVAEEQTTVETFLETYALLGCLICTSHSCEHGEYGVDNERKRFSIEVIGGISPMIRQQRLQTSKNSHEEGSASSSPKPCGDDCYLNGRPGTRARAWTENEIMLLKSFMSTLGSTNIPAQCATAVVTGRPCWDVSRQFDKLDLPVFSAPPAPSVQVKPLPWYDRKKKMLLGDWQDQTNTHEHQRKDYFDPCNHEGPCTSKNCGCIQNHIMCERFCRCTAVNCANKFTGCACHSHGKTCVSKQKDRPCICVQLNRECDPALCGGCGASERANPTNADNEALHATGCQNCALQRGKSKSVMLGKSKIAGYGLFATEDIAQDEFVIEYVGELISQDEGVRREARRGDVFDETSNSSYLFTLLEQEGIWVDAAIYGNLSRYINHQESNCNVTPRILYVNGEYRIKFTSLRDIRAGEELFFHYGENFPNLTKKLLQEEKAEKKRRKAKETEQNNGEKQKKKPGRKPGKKPGQKPGRKPGRPGRKPKKKSFAKIESDPEDDDDVVEPSEEPFPDIDSTLSRKRKRGLGEEDSGSGEYRPGTDTDDIMVDVGVESPTRKASRLRKRLGAPMASKGFSAAASGRPETEDAGDESGEFKTTPKRQRKKPRRIMEDATIDEIDEALIVESKHVGTPKRRGRKPRAQGDAGTIGGGVPSTAPASALGSRPSSSRFQHTEARLELDSNSAGEEVSPSRTRTRRPMKEPESSPLSTPDSDIEFPEGMDPLDSDLRPPSRRARTKKSANGDDEYNGNSWNDSDGARHAGGSEDSEDDEDEEGNSIDRSRTRRRPARYED